MKLAKQIAISVLLSAGLGTSACSPAFWGGTATGVLATGAGYELQARRQMQKLDDDLEHGRIDRKTYEERKQQIEKGSIIY